MTFKNYFRVIVTSYIFRNATDYFYKPIVTKHHTVLYSLLLTSVLEAELYSRRNVDPNNPRAYSLVIFNPILVRIIFYTLLMWCKLHCIASLIYGVELQKYFATVLLHAQGMLNCQK